MRSARPARRAASCGRPRPLLGALLAALLAVPATGGEEVRSAGGAAGPPDVALRPAPAGVLDRLPPGTRAAAEQAALVSLETPHGEYLSERVAALDVVYTVDPRLDERVRQVLADRSVGLAHVILMDPRTGEVFSYVSTDPEAFPATRPYPTASLMKVVTAAALLRHDPRAARQSCRYVGSPYQLLRANLVPPAGGGRLTSVWQALAVSNNQCFARLAVHDLGEAALHDEIQRVGLLEPPGAGHAAGRVATIGDDLQLGYLGSGLWGSAITPLAAARLAGLLAEGRLVTPHWVAEVRDPDGTPRPLPRGEAPSRAWPEGVAQELRERLVAVTEEGTARRAFRDTAGDPVLGPVRVSGKTGTVSGTDPRGLYRWFIGVAPAERPRVAIATLVVGPPGGAGAGATEIAAATLQAVFCGSEVCTAQRAEVLQLRAPARAAETERLLAERRRRLEAERLARDLERAFETEAAHEVVDLDQPPRPLGAYRFEFPPRLRRSPAEGEIVLLLELSPEGEVVDVAVSASDLPDFEGFVSAEVRTWRFTPPTRAGRPVHARARLPIAIQVR